jgi:hypothetical protein
MSTVRDLLRCSMRTAYDLTAAARDAAEAERDQQIAELKAEGNSVRAIAGTGISRSTVQRADVPKVQPAEMGQLMTSRTHSDHAREERARQRGHDMSLNSGAWSLTWPPVFFISLC